ncbi:MAG: carbohydrate ABC transporter permease [Desulfobacterales bacterium]|nr:MAG: carbohydrate ABC transporter permease [Desulfobacterales bacterium]
MLKKTLFWITTLVVLSIVIGPLLWIYLTAFKGPDDIFTTELKKLIVFTPTLENFERLFTDYPYWFNLGNTAIVSVVSTIFVMIVSLPAAYSFARWNTGGGHLLFVTISTRMFPGVVAAIPFFIVFRSLGLLDTHAGLILLYIYFNTSFATFLLYGFFREVPAELEYAAMIDGYGRMEIFRKIVFPLILPGLAVTTVFCLIWSWNEFFYAFLFTRLTARTVNVLISSFWGSIEVQYGPMAAGAGIAILPTLVAAWLMQRYIIRGLTFGAVKG